VALIFGGFIGQFLPAQAWGERHGEEHSAEALSAKMLGIYSSISEARVVATSPPAIQGLGSFSGFSFILEGVTIDTLLSRESVNCARQSSTRLQAVFTTLRQTRRSYRLRLTATKLGLQVPVDDVLNTMQNYLARYINDFNLQGRTYRVY